MHIKYYDNGALVSFTDKEAETTYRITDGGRGMRPLIPATNEYNPDAFGFLLSGFALMSMFENLRPESTLSRRLQKEQSCELMVQQLGGPGKLDYAIGNIKGNIQYETDFNFIDFLQEYIEQTKLTDDVLTNGFHIDDGEYCDEFGNPFDEDDDMCPYLTSELCSRLENEVEPDTTMYLYGGTDDVVGLKHHIPEDIKNAKIYILNGKYYLIGESEVPGLEMLPEFVLEHGVLYAGKKKTSTIISLLKD